MLKQIFKADGPEVALALSAILLFLITAHFDAPHGGGHGLNLTFNALSWIPVSIIIGAGLAKIHQRGCFRYSTVSISLWICWIVLSVPYLYSDYVSAIHTADRHLGLLAGVVTYCCLQQFDQSTAIRKLLFTLCIASALIETVYASYQYIHWNHISSFYRDAEIHKEPTGVFRQPNVLASYIATGVVLCFIWILDHVKNAESTANEKFKYLPALVLLFAIIGTALIVAQRSRVGWVGLSIGITLLSIRAFQSNDIRLWLTRLFLPLALGLALGSALLHAQPDSKGELDRLASAGSRTTIYSISVELFQTHWPTGSGYGRFRPEFLEAYADRKAADPQTRPAPPNLAHPHNELLLWGIEGGIIGITGLLIPAIALAWRLRRAGLSAALKWASALSPLLLHAFVELPFYLSVPHWILFLTLLYLCDADMSPPATYTVAATRLIRLFSIATPTLVTLFMLTQLHTIQLFVKMEKHTPPNFSALSAVINPFGSLQSVNFALMTHRLMLASNTGNTQEMREYIAWADQTYAFGTYAEVQSNAIVAQTNLGEIAQASRRLERSLHLFPDNALFPCMRDALIRLQKRQASNEPAPGIFNACMHDHGDSQIPRDNDSPVPVSQSL